MTADLNFCQKDWRAAVSPCACEPFAVNAVEMPPNDRNKHKMIDLFTSLFP
jgi:hypothetical protein